MIQEATQETFQEKVKTKQRYKMVCIDLDGTLLDANHTVSNANLEALKKATKQGVKIVIATGRPYFNAKAHAHLFDKKAYVIGSNGAIAMDSDSGKKIHHETLTKQQVQSLLDFAYASNMPPTLYTPDRMYIAGLKNYLMHFYFTYKSKKSGIGQERVKDQVTFVPSKKAWKKYEHLEFDKMVMYQFNQEMAKVKLKELQSKKDFEVALTMNFCMEVTRKGVSKGVAVAALAKHLGILQEEVIAIGDSENDMTMVAYAGLGVAMDNGIEGLKKIAQVVAPHHNDPVKPGVAHIIEKYVLD